MLEMRVPVPSSWVERHLDGFPAAGHVLDVACGGGRHLRLLSRSGRTLTGIDRTLDGVRDLVGVDGITLIEADLENGAPFPVAGQRFGGVIVTNYLYRPILPAIVAAVADDGLLVYETFALGHEKLGRPSNPDFLLRPNELIDAVRPHLTIVAYTHGRIDDDGRPRVVQRIAAVGPRHAWAELGKM